MMGNGLKTKLRVMANTYMLMDLFIRGNGRMTSKMEKGRRNGQMVLLTKDNTREDLNMGKEYLPGPTLHLIQDNLKTT